MQWILKGIVKGKSILGKVCLLIFSLFCLLFIQIACQTPSHSRFKIDGRVSAIIKEKQKQALGDVQDFSLERPSELLRRRLLLEQRLPYAGEASLGTDKLKRIQHWPEDAHPGGGGLPDLSQKQSLLLKLEEKNLCNCPLSRRCR